MALMMLSVAGSQVEAVGLWPWGGRRRDRWMVLRFRIVGGSCLWWCWRWEGMMLKFICRRGVDPKSSREDTYDENIPSMKSQTTIL